MLLPLQVRAVVLAVQQVQQGVQGLLIQALTKLPWRSRWPFWTVPVQPVLLQALAMSAASLSLTWHLHLLMRPLPLPFQLLVLVLLLAARQWGPAVLVRPAED